MTTYTYDLKRETRMIKEFLIFLIFLIQINAENSTAFDECFKDFQLWSCATCWDISKVCIDECLKAKGQPLSNGKVCIPRKYMDWIQFPLNYKEFGKTKFSITLSNVQIIEIGSNEITISMNTRIAWSDYRLTFGVDRAFLSEEDQKQVWSPRIVVGTNMMSKSKETEEIEVSRWPQNSLVKTFYLLTTVKCKMNFQTFPFDNHTCNIEVSVIFSHF